MGVRFRFEAYATLRKRLGEYDAIVEWNELAVRSFLHRISESPELLLKKESEEHRIKVDYDEKLKHGSFSARRSQFYLLSVYQQAEQFFNDLLDDLPQGKSWKTEASTARRDSEAQLDWIVRRVNANDSKAFSDEFTDLVQVFNYFRLVRNAFMHEGDQTRQLKNSHEKLVKRSQERKKLEAEEQGYSSRVPNSYEALTFDDFIQFTQVTKQIALRLCEVLKPDLDSLLTHHFSTENHHGLRQYLGNDERFSNACATLLSRKFNLNPAEINYAVPIVRKLI